MKLYNEASAIIHKSAKFETAWSHNDSALKEAKELRRVVEKYIEEAEKDERQRKSSKALL